MTVVGIKTIPTEILCKIFCLLQGTNLSLSMYWRTLHSDFRGLLGKFAGAGERHLYPSHIYGLLFLCTGLTPTFSEALAMMLKSTDVPPYTSSGLDSYLLPHPSRYPTQTMDILIRKL